MADARPPAEQPFADLPFADVKVLDLTWVVAGPTVGRMLSDYGARVVHVESSRRVETARAVGPNHGGVPGAEQSALYGNMNAGKWGLTLDLSAEAARKVVRDLVRWADLVTEAFTPGVMRSWGLDYATLRRIKPDLVMLSTCLMGQTGPHAGVAGFGQQGAAIAGFQNLAGWPDRPPSGPFGPYTDYIAPRFSIAAVLAALDHRRRTGEGCYIDQSQAESAMHFLAPALVAYFATGQLTERQGNADPMMAPHGVYPCRPPQDRDEGWVAIAVRDDAEWMRLAEVMGQPALAHEARYAVVDGRREQAAALDEIVGAWTSDHTPDQVEGLLQAQGIPAHAVLNSADLAADAQLRQRGHFIALDHPIHGRTVVEGSRYRLSRTPAVVEHAAPTYGQHNDEVLRGILGYDEDRIATLAASGALT